MICFFLPPLPNMTGVLVALVSDYLPRTRQDKLSKLQVTLSYCSKQTAAM